MNCPNRPYFFVSLLSHFGKCFELASLVSFPFPFGDCGSLSSKLLATPSMLTASRNTSSLNAWPFPLRLQLNINNVLAANPACRIVCVTSVKWPFGTRSKFTLVSPQVSRHTQLKCKVLRVKLFFDKLVNISYCFICIEAPLDLCPIRKSNSHITLIISKSSQQVSLPVRKYVYLLFLVRRLLAFHVS